MNGTIDRQDSNAPLGVFCVGVLVHRVPPGKGETDRAYAIRDRVAAESCRPVTDYEVLVICPDHHWLSAVDCTEHDDASEGN